MAGFFRFGPSSNDPIGPRSLSPGLMRWRWEIAVERAHYADPRHHRRAIEFGDQDQDLDRGLPFRDPTLAVWKFLDVPGGVLESDEPAAAWQHDRILEGRRPRHLFSPHHGVAPAGERLGLLQRLLLGHPTRDGTPFRIVVELKTLGGVVAPDHLESLGSLDDLCHPDIKAWRRAGVESAYILRILPIPAPPIGAWNEFTIWKLFEATA